MTSIDEKNGQNRFLNFEEQPRVQLLRELSKEVCVKCETFNEEVCTDCRVHRLINQLLIEMTR